MLKKFAALFQRLVRQHPSGGIQEIVGYKNHRYFSQQVFTNGLSPESLLEFAKRHDSLAARRHNFAIDYGVNSQISQGRLQLRKTMRDLVHGAGVNSHATVPCVCLRANSIKLVLHKKLAGHRPRDVGQVGGGRCEHEFDWMKHPHANVMHVIGPRPNGSFTNVPKQHVHLGNSRQRPLECSCNRVLYQAFSKPDAQVSSQQLD